MRRRNFFGVFAALAATCGIGGVSAAKQSGATPEIIRVELDASKEKAIVRYSAQSVEKIVDLLRLYTKNLALTLPDGRSCVVCDYGETCAEYARTHAELEFNAEAFSVCGDRRWSHRSAFLDAAASLGQRYPSLVIELGNSVA